MSQPNDAPAAASANLSAGVFAERDGRILLLKRSVGEMVGAWYIPGGGVEKGETLEEGALRELLEETGLVPTGPLRPCAHALLPVYGSQGIQIFYAAECATGDVVLDHEHSEHQWLTAQDYRDRFFSDDVLARLRGADPRIAQIVSGVRGALDAYLLYVRMEQALLRA